MTKEKIDILVNSSTEQEKVKELVNRKFCVSMGEARRLVRTFEAGKMIGDKVMEMLDGPGKFRRYATVEKCSDGGTGYTHKIEGLADESS